MRINHEESIASRNVLRHDIEEKRRLADAGRAENCHMAQPLIARERHGLAVRRMADVGMVIHSRDCRRGLRYGSWGNRLSACYAETNPDMDRRRSASAIPASFCGRFSFFMFGVGTCSSCDGLRSSLFWFWVSSRKDKSGSRLGTLFDSPRGEDYVTGVPKAISRWELRPRCRRRKIRRPPADYIFRAGRPVPPAERVVAFSFSHDEFRARPPAPFYKFAGPATWDACSIDRTQRTIVTRVPKAKGRRDYGVAARGRAAKARHGGGVPFARRAFFGLAGTAAPTNRI